MHRKGNHSDSENCIYLTVGSICASIFWLSLIFLFDNLMCGGPVNMDDTITGYHIEGGSPVTLQKCSNNNVWSDESINMNTTIIGYDIKHGTHRVGRRTESHWSLYLILEYQKSDLSKNYSIFDSSHLLEEHAIRDKMKYPINSSLNVQYNKDKAPYIKLIHDNNLILIKNIIYSFVMLTITIFCFYKIRKNN